MRRLTGWGIGIALVAIAACDDSSSTKTPPEQCDALVATLCQKIFSCGAGGAFASESDCEAKEQKNLACSTWTLPMGCTYDWGPFQQCLSDVSAESCSDAQAGVQPPSCHDLGPPACPGTDIRCGDHAGQSSNNDCSETLSNCSDGHSYKLDCMSGSCSCEVDGQVTQAATGNQCSGDEAVLNMECGWHLYVEPKPDLWMPDASAPRDMTAGCTVDNVFYLPGTVDPNDECEHCDPTISADSWSPLDGIACGGGCGTCTSSRCQPVELATGEQPTAIAVDGSNVYWVDTTRNTLSQVPKQGGATTVLASNLYNADALAIDATSAYVGGMASSGAGGLVSKIPLAGGSATQVATAGGWVTSLAVDATRVYWTDQAKGSVFSAPLAGGTATTLATGQAMAFGITVSGGNAFFTDSGDGTVWKIAVAGGTPMQIASGETGPRAITHDASSVYWVDYSTGSVWQAPLAGGTPQTLNPTDFFNGASAIAVDAQYVYVLVGGLYKVPLTGGNAITLVDGQLNDDGAGLAVDDQCVYWTHGNGFTQGHVSRAPK